MTTIERPAVTLRPFTAADYDPVVAVLNAAFPDYGWTAAELRHWDDGWDHEKLFKRRVVAEEAGVVLGHSETFHSRGSFVLDNYNLDGEWGYSLLDVPHRLNANGTFVVPAGAGHKRLATGFGNALLGGWSVTMAARFQNGFPEAAPHTWRATVCFESSDL